MIVTAEDIVDRLKAPRSLRPRGDVDLNMAAPWAAPGDPRAAAVLVPIVLRPDGLTMLLTERQPHLKQHAGQVAFPGGKVDPGDTDAADAALREAEEEIGLDRVHVDLVGTLDTYVTRTGFSITPWVGFVTPPFNLVPDCSEVAAVFETPLGFLLDQANHEIHSVKFEGVMRHFYAMPWNGHFIWGATAGMLVNFAEIVTGQPRKMRAAS